MKALEGSLEVFTMPDIFRLLAMNQVTGALNIVRQSGEGTIYFREGEVYFAFSSLTREFLGQRVVAARLISQRKLLQLLDDQKNQGPDKRLGDLLVEGGYVSPELLETLLKEQIQDAVFNMLQWDRGDFSFISGASSEQEVGLSVSVENLLMESSRRLEEWEVIERKIPNLETVLVMAPSPPDVVEINIKPDEWSLLVSADGSRSIKEIAEVNGRGDFDTCRILYGLVTAGLLEDSSRRGELAGGALPRAPLREADDVLVRAPRAGAAAVAEAHLQPEAEPAQAMDDTLQALVNMTESSQEEPEPAAAPDAGDEPEAEEEPAKPAAKAAKPKPAPAPAKAEPEPEPEPEAGEKKAGDAAISKEMLQRLIAGVRNL